MKWTFTHQFTSIPQNPILFCYKKAVYSSQPAAASMDGPGLILFESIMQIKRL